MPRYRNALTPHTSVTPHPTLTADVKKEYGTGEHAQMFYNLMYNEHTEIRERKKTQIGEETESSDGDVLVRNRSSGMGNVFHIL